MNVGSIQSDFELRFDNLAKQMSEVIKMYERLQQTIKTSGGKTEQVITTSSERIIAQKRREANLIIGEAKKVSAEFMLIAQQEYNARIANLDTTNKHIMASEKRLARAELQEMRGLTKETILEAQARKAAILNEVSEEVEALKLKNRNEAAARAEARAARRAMLDAEKADKDREASEDLLREARKQRGIIELQQQKMGLAAAKAFTPPPVPPTFTASFAGFADEFRKNVWSPLGMMSRDISNKMMQMGMVGVAAFGALVKSGADYETTLNKVRNNTLMNDAEFEFMRKNVEALGKESGAPLDKLALGWMHVTNLGYHFNDALSIVTQGMRTAVATNSDADQTIELLAKVMKEYNFVASDTARINDILFKAAALGNMTFEEFSKSSNRALGMAANLRVPIEQVAAAMSTLTQHGLAANQAQTQLVNVFNKISNPTAQTRKELEFLNKVLKEHHVLGIDLSKDFTQEGLAAKGLPGVFSDLTKAASYLNIPVSELAQRGFPNLRATLAALILTGTGVNDWFKNYSIIVSDSDNISSRYRRSLDTVNQQLGILKNELVILSADVIRTVRPALTQLINLTKSAFEWFNQFAPSTKTAAVELAFFGSTALLVGGQVLKLTTLILELRSAILATAGITASGSLSKLLSGGLAGIGAAGAAGVGAVGTIGAYGLYRELAGAAKNMNIASEQEEKAANMPVTNVFGAKIQRTKDLINILKALPPELDIKQQHARAEELANLYKELTKLQELDKKFWDSSQKEANDKKRQALSDSFAKSLASIQNELMTSTTLTDERRNKLIQDQNNLMRDAHKLHVILPMGLDPERIKGIGKIGLTDDPSDPLGAKAYEKQQKEMLAAQKKSQREAEQEAKRSAEERRRATEQVLEDTYNLTHSEFEQNMHKANKELADALASGVDPELAKAKHKAQYKKIFDDQFFDMMESRLEAQQKTEEELKKQNNAFWDAANRLFESTHTPMEMKYLEAWRQYWKDLVDAPELADQILNATLNKLDDQVKNAENNLAESLSIVTRGLKEGMNGLNQFLSQGLIELKFPEQSLWSQMKEEFNNIFKNLHDKSMEQAESVMQYDYDMGKVSTENFIAFMKERLKLLDKYSDEWMRINREIKRMEDEIRSNTISGLLNEQVTKLNRNTVREFARGVKGLFVDLFDNLISGHRNWLKVFFDDFKKMLIRMAAEFLASQVFKLLADIFSSGKGKSKGGVPGGGGGSGTGISGFLSNLGNAASMIPGVGAAGAIGGAIIGGLGDLFGFADGGFVPGPTGKGRLALVHGGELILNQDQQRTVASVSGMSNLHLHFDGGVTVNSPMDVNSFIEEVAWRTKRRLAVLPRR